MFDFFRKFIKKKKEKNKISDDIENKINSEKKLRNNILFKSYDNIKVLNKYNFYNSSELSELINNYTHLVDIFNKNDKLLINKLHDINTYYISQVISLILRFDETCTKKNSLLLFKKQKTSEQINILKNSNLNSSFSDIIVSKYCEYIYVSLRYLYLEYKGNTKKRHISLKKNGELSNKKQYYLKYENDKSILSDIYDIINSTNIKFSYIHNNYIDIELLNHLNNNNFIFTYLFSFNYLDTDFEMFSCDDKLFVININESKIYGVDNKLLDYVQKDEYTEIFNINNKINELNKILNDLDIELSINIKLDQEIVDNLIIVSKKLEELSDFSIEDNYTLELEYLKELIKNDNNK